MQNAKRFFIGLVFILILVFVTVCTFNGVIKNYILLSFLLAAGIIALFFISFEKRNPGAKDILPIVILCVSASLGRVIFSFIPQVQPVTAIVIIAGICLGRYGGFLTGALCALISNMILGQGPWTVWQMLAWGAIGFFAGFIKNPKMPLLFIYGFISAFVYGYIVDIWTVASIGDAVTPALFLAVYSAATIFNFLHAVGNVAFLYLLYPPFSKKLNRIRDKYGVMRGI